MFTNLTIKARLAVTMGLLAAIMVAIGAAGLYGLSQSKEELRTVYEDRTIAIGQLSEIARLVERNRINLLESIDDPSRENIQRRFIQSEGFIKRITEVWDAYMATELTVEEKGLAEKFLAVRGRYVKEGLQPAFAALRAGDTRRAVRINAEIVRPTNNEVREQADALIKLQLDVAKQEYGHSLARYQLIRNSSIAAILVGLVLSAVMGILLIRAIVGSIARASAAADAVARGDFSVNVAIERHDETAQLFAAMHNMISTLKGFSEAQIEMKTQHDAGAIGYRIDAQRFSGSYREMARMSNELVAAHIAVKMRVVEVVTRYAKGDLSVDMDR
ncbi:MAG: Tar ligand binding domain-containing protein, partial [Betaproteobacteria bacterium]|nr:Tar ligand binding domain-containing protein [Betaproteobacteria bacterium]